MYIIPTVEDKKDRRKPTVATNNTVSRFIQLNPEIYTVQSYPLPILYGYDLQIFNPFVIAPSQWRLLSVNLGGTQLTSVSSLSALSTNTYYKKLNRVYPLLATTVGTVTLEFVVFTNINGLTTDIGIYTDIGCVLQEVNLTGHIATFSSMGRTFTLDTDIETKTGYPIPAALLFTLDIDLTNYKPFSVYNLTGNIGSVDYILYNNQLYTRSRTVVPQKQTFTTRSNGGLLWI